MAAGFFARKWSGDYPPVAETIAERRLHIVRPEEGGGSPEITEMPHEELDVTELLGDPVTVTSNEMVIEDSFAVTVGEELRHGHYRLVDIEKVGSGAQGTAYKARLEPILPEDTATEEVDIRKYREAGEVVLKLVVVDMGNQDEAESKIKAVEAEIARLADDNSLFDAWMAKPQNSDSFVFVIEMKKLEGPDKDKYARDLRRNSPEQLYSSEQVLKFMLHFRSVLYQLRELAERGVQHLDVKGNNILVNNDQARLTDFGVAKRTAGSHNAKVLEGTPIFMSPDRANNAQDVLADVYALALVLARDLTLVERTEEAKGLSTHRSTMPRLLGMIASAEYWKFTPASRFPSRFADDPVLAMSDVLENILQPGKGMGEYTNPYGTTDYTKENLITTIDAVLAEVEPIVQAQIHLVEDQLAGEWLSKGTDFEAEDWEGGREGQE